MKRILLCAALAAALLACSEPMAPVTSLSAPDVLLPASQTQSVEPLVELVPEVAIARPETGLTQAAPLQIFSSATLIPPDAASLHEVRAVLVRFELIGAPVTQGLALEFVAPQDVVFERRQGALEAGPFASQTVEYELPVAGTLIDLNELTGRWTARLNLEGEAIGAQDFELSP